MNKEQTRLRVKLGAAEIEYEGGTQFLKDQIMPAVDKILEMVYARVDLQRLRPALQLEAVHPLEKGNDGQPSHTPNSPGPSTPTKSSLSSYLKATGDTSKQVQRFLATAGWLHRRGQKELSPSLIAKTLKENHQKKLANPADCLNKNVTKGYCEKTDDGFFITPDGWETLGGSQ